ncbi:MAG: GNAT family N-acetyltransferase [Candidatus Dormibacteria bacterium]
MEVPVRATRPVATEPIQTERLSLVLMDEAALEALARRDLREASERLGADLPPDFPAPDGTDDEYIRLQREKLRTHFAQREWCARLMVRRSDRAAVGHCGFHGPPGALGRAEVGYTVFPAHRRQGLATEAVAGLVAWAWEQGERTVVAAVPPANAASLGVVRKVGFVQTGRRIDPVYPSFGEELVFEISRADLLRETGGADVLAP